MRPAAALADLVVGFHFLWLGFLVAGGFLALRNPRWLWPHAAVVAWGVVGVAVGLPCPVTAFEKWLREQAGQSPYRGPFIEHYIDGVLYPASAKHLVMALTAAVVLVSWALVAHRYRGRVSLHRARSRTASNSVQGGTATPGSSGESSTAPVAHSAHSARSATKR